jgi:hypothetical protein
MIPILIIVGLLGIVAGVSGVVEARKKTQAEGQHSLMHYPAPVPWLRSKVTTARWVDRIGRLYIGFGLVLCVGAAASLMQRVDQRPDNPCDGIAAQLLHASALGGLIELSVSPPKTGDCAVHGTAPSGVRLFSVESSFQPDPIGEQFNAHVQALSNQGMAIDAIERLGFRSIFARPGSPARHNPTLVFEDNRGIHTVDFNPAAMDDDQISGFIQALQGSQTNEE